MFNFFKRNKKKTLEDVGIQTIESYICLCEKALDYFDAIEEGNPNKIEMCKNKMEVLKTKADLSEKLFQIKKTEL